MQDPERADHPNASHVHTVSIDDTFDFLNTLDLESGNPREHLNTPADAYAWFADRGLIHADPAAAPERSLDRVRRLRAALRAVADAVVDHRAADTDAVATVNLALLGRAAPELAPTADGVAVGHRHMDDPLDDALARIVEPFVAELATGQPDRVRVCANDRCAWVFYDESRGGRRRWCEMASCGNRAKAARHRARKKAAAAGS